MLVPLHNSVRCGGEFAEVVSNLPSRTLPQDGPTPRALTLSPLGLMALIG